jgi:copper(I)-binding protein
MKLPFFPSAALAALLAALLAAPQPPEAHAAEPGIRIVDPFARSSSPTARSGAAFMVIENHGPEADRLIAARSDVAERVELHTHKVAADGVMRMVEVPEGFVIPAGGAHALARGADHVMFLGLTRALAEGDRVAVTLVFERAGEVSVEVPVAGMRAQTGAGMGHDGAPPSGATSAPHDHGHAHQQTHTQSSGHGGHTSGGSAGHSGH